MAAVVVLFVIRVEQLCFIYEEKGRREAASLPV